MPPSDRSHAVPPALWVVIGVFGASALATATTALTGGVLGLPVLLVAAALAALAVRLHQGGRVARALAAVTAVALLLGSLTAASSASWVVVGLATTAVSGVLLLAPSVRMFFAGPRGRAPASGVSVALVRIVACVVGGALTLLALIAFVGGVIALGSGSAASSSGSGALGSAMGGLFGMLGGLVLALALFSGAVGAFWFWAAHALPRASRGARIAVTVVCGLDALQTLAMLGLVPGPALVMLALLGAVVGALWLPADARRHFGDRPLPAVERWHQQALVLGFSVAASVTAPATPAAPAAPAAPTPAPAPTPTRRVDDDAPTGRVAVHRPVAPRAPATPAPGVPAPRRAAPRSGPIPVADLDGDPLTEPLRLGRHARRPDATGQPA